MQQEMKCVQSSITRLVRTVPSESLKAVPSAFSTRSVSSPVNTILASVGTLTVGIPRKVTFVFEVSGRINPSLHGRNANDRAYSTALARSYLGFTVLARRPFSRSIWLSAWNSCSLPLWTLTPKIQSDRCNACAARTVAFR